MEVLVRTFYGSGSGVSSSLFGTEITCLSTSSDDVLLIVGEILSQLAQGNDINISFFPEV